MIPHSLYLVNAKGEIKKEVSLPPQLLNAEKRFGFEGIPRVDNTLWMVIQHEWQDDPKDHVKLVSYNTDFGEWGAVYYKKAKPTKGWVGMSEINAHGDFFYVIERDNQIEDAAITKKIYRIPTSEMFAEPLNSPKLPVVSKELVRDLIPDLQQFEGLVDKIEGLAITADGEIFVSTDNDGVDDSSGETFFWSIGKIH